jgi:hypothetical protein
MGGYEQSLSCLLRRFVASICTVDALGDVEYTNEGEDDDRGGICINVMAMEQRREDGRTWGDRE